VHKDQRSKAIVESSSMRDASMSCSELACSAFRHYFLRDTRTAVATVCSADAIGGGDWGEGRLLPNLVRSLTAGEPVNVADAAEVAVWHVLELVHGYLLLAQKLCEGGEQYSGAWDFAPAKRCVLPATRVSNDFVKLWDTDFKLEVDEASSDDELGSNGHNTKARTELRWSELLLPEQAMRWTAQWYRAFYSEPSSAWRITEDQIARFMTSV